MKKIALKLFTVLMLVAILVATTSCLSVLSGILTGVDTIFKFVDSYGSDTELPDNVVYGSENPLAVTFYNGNVTAIWDYNTDSSYTLNITEGDIVNTFSDTDEGDTYFSDGKFDLKSAGYDYDDTFTLKLTETNGISRNSVSIDYEALDKSIYDEYTKNVESGFTTIDYYIATRYEFFEFFAYVVIFRPSAEYITEKKTSFYSVEQEFLLAYDYESLYTNLSKEDAYANEVSCAIASFEDSAAYNYAYEINADDEASIELRFSYEMNPTQTTTTNSSYKNAVTPVINEMPHYKIFNEPATRMFAIDLRTESITVETSDQLYFVIKKGYKPNCVKDSNAEAIYNEMRNILSYIMTDETTQKVKAHYIYDYIVNTVIYDYDFIDVVLKNQDEDSVDCFTYKCLYMEGVFGYTGNGNFSSRQCVAICDGLSKAYLCMAQIEGIETIKVSGAVDGDAHAWNKIKIDGKWYMVDTTWGNLLDGSKEYLRHDYFMVSDDARHIEDSWYYYPKAG